MPLKVSLPLAIVLAALVIALSPLLWTDHVFLPYQSSKPVPLPAGCLVESRPFGNSNIAVAHCPFWVNFPN